MGSLTEPLTDEEVRRVIDDAFTSHIQNAVAVLMANPVLNQDTSHIVKAITIGRKLHHDVIVAVLGN